MVEHYFEKHLPQTVKLISCPTKFDSLVVDIQAEPERFTTMYDPKDVRGPPPSLDFG